MQAYSDHGSGVIGVLALDGLFLLITEVEDLFLANENDPLESRAL